jgi:mannosyltransferase
VRRDHLDDAVLLTGEVDDAELRRWYAHGDLFALFSRYEAFGLVYLEAMAYGVPVLTHAVGATEEIAGAGAVVVPPYDAPAAEAAHLALPPDDARRHAPGRAAAAHAAGHTWNAVAERFLAVYGETIDDRR